MIRKRRFLSLIVAGFAAAGLSGCNSVATETPGIFVDNVEGTYDIAAITETNGCVANFDPVVNIVQNKSNFSLLGQSGGFEDLVGVFDDHSSHTYTLAGGGKKCTGSVIDGLLTNVCTLSIQTCTTDSAGAQNCSTVDNSCEVTYQKK